MTVTAHHHVLTEPTSGQVIDLPVGAFLELQFRRPRLGLSEWHVEDRPSHLVPVHESSHGFHFLAFTGDDDRACTLRLVRRRTERDELCEVRDLTVLVSA